MTLLKIAAVVGAGFMLMTAPALAGLASPAHPQWVKPDSQVEQIRYRRNIIPEAIIGGVISGVVGGLIGGNCYYNDCGYDNGPYYGGGGYYGGGYSGGGGHGGRK
jgi:tetrahydromethanopterin S-methyltransferase subunit F